MKITTIIKAIVAAIVLAVISIVTCNNVHKIDDTEWQAVQHLSGQVEIKSSPGMYFAFFPKITEYPRNVAMQFYKKTSKESPNDESTCVTFNDGGTADIDVTLRLATPSEDSQKREFHRQFNGSMKDIKMAVWSHLTNVLKASGPLMSASENQASRKSEFNSVVLDQLNDGLYEMRRVERELDQVDEKGNKLRVYATEIVKDPKTGKPIITQESPLARYGVKFTQFSITETTYDPQTLKQFGTKKEAFLKAESAKADRENEVQQRLMVEEKGRREKAEVEAISLKEKAQAVITAQKLKEVAELNAARDLAVAIKQKETAETAASQELEVARIARQRAEEEGKAILTLAQAEKEKIALGGAISEKERLTLEMQKETAIGVANALSKVNVPQVTISGSGGPGQAGNSQQDLINLFLLKQNGLLDANKALVK